MTTHFRFAAIALVALTVPIHSASADEPDFPKIVPVLAGAPPEGFAIGKKYWAYNGSIDGSIYKVNLRTGNGRILVPAEPDFNAEVDCHKLGMRYDPRRNYLFVAGCINGDAYVFNADSGEQIMKYQLDKSGNSVINDIAITRDAVYFTDFGQPFIYRLPLYKKDRVPKRADAATAIPLTGDFGEGENLIDQYANGIVATPDEQTLIIGHSGTSKIFKVDPISGHADEIMLNPPLLGLPEGSFLDALVLHEGLLYILSPGETAAGDLVQVVELDEDMLTGRRVGVIVDSDMDGVASGAVLGDSLYVSNARYGEFPGLPTEYWVTKLNIYDVQPVE